VPARRSPSARQGTPPSGQSVPRFAERQRSDDHAAMDNWRSGVFAAPAVTERQLSRGGLQRPLSAVFHHRSTK